MDSGINSNFIPHDTVQKAGGGGVRSGNILDLLALISAILFVASIVLGAGVFLYQQFLLKNSVSKVDQLERAQAAFEPSLIQEITRLDDRMRVADIILSNHIALSIFFHMLEQETLTTISFRSLNFEATDPQNINIKMDGTAKSVNSIALQADTFSKMGIVTSPIFSNINREQDGVHFSLTALLNPAYLRYVGLISSQNAGAGPPEPSPEAQSSFYQQQQ